MSRLGDRQYFRQVLKVHGFPEDRTDELIDLMIKAMQDKILEDGSLIIPLLGTFNATVLPPRHNDRLHKDFPESLKVTFKPSRKGILKRWKEFYSSDAVQKRQLEKMAKELKL